MLKPLPLTLVASGCTSIQPVQRVRNDLYRHGRGSLTFGGQSRLLSDIDGTPQRRHHWKLSSMQKERLHQYLAQSPVLRALYCAKQQLNGFLVMKNLKAKRAKRMLPQFLSLIRQFEQSPAKALAATLRSWLEPIVRMWRFTKSNGITEGFHTKMEMLSRRAYGFRNFENYRMRVLAQCGWNGVINRV